MQSTSLPVPRNGSQDALEGSLPITTKLAYFQGRVTSYEIKNALLSLVCTLYMYCGLCTVQGCIKVLGTVHCTVFIIHKSLVVDLLTIRAQENISALSHNKLLEYHSIFIETGTVSRPFDQAATIFAPAL